MVTNRGTFEGNKQEIELVRLYNKKCADNFKLFELFNKQFNVCDLDKIFLCRVVTKQYSKLSNQLVLTRADAYAVKIEQDLRAILIANDYYIDEDILKENNIKYQKIEYSGISIKMQDSKKFQILKLTPSSFSKLFGNTELGAGASLFCLRQEELCKNKDLLNGWFTSPEKMCQYYGFDKFSNDFILDINACKNIKKTAEVKIKEMIDNSKELQDKVFKGLYLYEEPYSAHYIYKNNLLETLEYIPFQVTTGSGRSKGIYTIVLKPV